VTAALALRLAGVVLATFLLGGCWSIPAMEKSGLVTLLAIDQAPKDEFEVTASIDTPATSSASPGLGQMATALLRRGRGRTIVDAIAQLRLANNLVLDFTHLEAALVSESVARAGLARPLGDLTSSPEFVSTPYLLIVRDGTAQGTLEQLRLVKPRAEVLVTDTLSEARNRTPFVPRRIYELLDRVQMTGDDFTTVGVAIDKAEGGGPSTALQVSGQALFNHDRLVGWMGANATIGWVEASHQPGHFIVDVPSPTGTISLRTVASRRTIRILRSAQGPSAQIDIDLRERVAGVSGGGSAWWSHPAALKQVEQLSADKILRDVEDSLVTSKAAGADPFALGQYVRVSDPGGWPHMETRWNREGLARLPVEVRVRAHVVNVGSLLCPSFGACTEGLFKS